MAQSFQAYMTEALQESGLSDEAVTAALTKLYANEKLSPKLNALVKTATEDYKAQEGRVTQLRKASDDREKQLNEYYTKTNTEYNKVLAELEEARKTPGQQPQFDASKYLSREDFQAAMNQMGANYAGVIKDATSITAQHVARFGEAPDLEAIEALAADKKLTIRAAYSEYIAPRVQKEKEAADIKWKEDMRQEIEKDVRSKLNLPVDPRPSETAPVYARHESNKPSANMDQELLAAWNGADSK